MQEAHGQGQLVLLPANIVMHPFAAIMGRVHMHAASK